MELHKALRNIIQTDGPDILKEVRLVNILDDFQAYQDIPASKYILRAIISDGYMSKLLALGNWNSAAEALICKFIALTGFNSMIVSHIFHSIARALNWSIEHKTFDSEETVRRIDEYSPQLLLKFIKSIKIDIPSFKNQLKSISNIDLIIDDQGFPCFSACFEMNKDFDFSKDEHLWTVYTDGDEDFSGSSAAEGHVYDYTSSLQIIKSSIVYLELEEIKNTIIFNGISAL